jgi:hypothetical protein
MGKAEGKRLILRPTDRWGGNITTNHREIGWGDMDWIELAQERD